MQLACKEVLFANLYPGFIIGSKVRVTTQPPTHLFMQAKTLRWLFPWRVSPNIACSRFCQT